MKEAGRTSRTPRLTGDRRGKAEADRLAQDHPALQPVFPSLSRAAQRPSVLIVGSCRGKLFVADEQLIYAETLDAEEAVYAWLAQHGIRMTPKEKVSASQSARDAAGRIPSGPAKVRHGGGNNKC